MKVTFYMKEGCWLCDYVEEFLNGLRDRYGLEVRKVDIRSDEELYELYRTDIPVVEFPGGTVFRGRIKRQELVRYLDEHTK
ncbi:MAG: glutaredoxin family protein [Nitrospirota bacterium]